MRQRSPSYALSHFRCRRYVITRYSFTSYVISKKFVEVTIFRSNAVGVTLFTLITTKLYFSPIILSALFYFAETLSEFRSFSIRHMASLSVTQCCEIMFLGLKFPAVTFFFVTPIRNTDLNTRNFISFKSGAVNHS